MKSILPQKLINNNILQPALQHLKLDLNSQMFYNYDYLFQQNTWDPIPNKNQQTTLHYEDDVRTKLRILNWVPIVYSTAIVRNNVNKYVFYFIHNLSLNFLFKYSIVIEHSGIIVATSEVEKERSRWLSAATLNQVVHEALVFKSPARTSSTYKQLLGHLRLFSL